MKIFHHLSIFYGYASVIVCFFNPIFNQNWAKYIVSIPLFYPCSVSSRRPYKSYYFIRHFGLIFVYKTIVLKRTCTVCGTAARYANTLWITPMSRCMSTRITINTLRPEQHVAYIFKCILWNEKYAILIQILLKFANGPIHHDDVIQWKHFPRYWPFVRGIHRSSVNSPNKGQWRRALMLSFICAWINGWVNNREAGDLRRHRTHYDVTLMWYSNIGSCNILAPNRRQAVIWTDV